MNERVQMKIDDADRKHGLLPNNIIYVYSSVHFCV